MKYRIEKDTMGEMQVPIDKYYGAQTARSLENFKIGDEKMPYELVLSIVELKKACALANFDLGNLDEVKKDLIVKVCDEILSGEHKDNFGLSVWQTGSGTQTNMNVNEVIAGRANEISGEKTLHPNDDVNKSQSSNDIFPSAMHLCAIKMIKNELMPKLNSLVVALTKLSEEYKDLVKIGRTHLQDAVPMSLGDEISAWEFMLKHNLNMLEASSRELEYLAIGGTAVGTGMNSPKNFDECVVKHLKEFGGVGTDGLIPSDNKFYSLTSKDAIVYSHGAIKALATNLVKIANDVRHLSSGPRAGLGELIIPQNEPGSSIMPGKVNPTQCEAMIMVCYHIMGNDVAISLGASSGNFQLNVAMPMIIYNYTQSVKLMGDAILSFCDNCIRGLRANEEVIKHNVRRSLMNVTALTPIIGYEKAAKIAKKAHEENTTLKEATLSLEYMSEEKFDEIMKELGVC